MRHVIPLVIITLLTASCVWSVGTPAEGDRTPTAATAPTVVQPTMASAVAEVYLPTYRPMEIVPLAVVGGRLVLDDGCLWLEHEEGRVLPLWPRGSRVEQDGDTLVVVQHGGRARAEVGTDVLGGGGGYGPEEYDFVVELIGEEIPPACRGDDHYSLVYDVRAADE
jgi:hypothetical protein